MLDWDRTLRRGWTLNAWVDHLIADGLVEEGYRQTLDGHFGLYLRREIDHDELAVAANTAYAEAVEGLGAAELEKRAEAHVREDLGSLFPYTERLLTGLDRRGLRVVILSGVPHELIDAYCRMLRVGEPMGLRLDTESGFFTGVMTTNPGMGVEKARVVSSLTAGGSKIVVAAGDSVSDLPQLERARIRIVVDNPDLSRRLAPGTFSVDSDVPDIGWVDEVLGRI